MIVQYPLVKLFVMFNVNNLRVMRLVTTLAIPLFPKERKES